MQLSRELEEKLWGDPAILRDLAHTEASYRAGDRTALFEAIAICARFQAVIPEWAADAILEIEVQLKNGRLEDFNDAFGSWGKQGTRYKAYRQGKHAKEVLERLMVYRLEGGNLNAAEAFQPIADELGISRRDVEEIYKRNGAFIKDIPRGNPSGGRHVHMNLVLAPPRRHGRPILRDSEKSQDTIS